MQTPSLQLLPKSTTSILETFIVYSVIPQMQGLSSWLWGFNPLLLRLHGKISLSLLCSHSSWGSALVLTPPLNVGHPQASVPDRRVLKQWLIRALLLIQAREREGYCSHNWNAGQAFGGRGQCDIATAWGTPCVLLGKLSLDHGTLAVTCCTVSGGVGGVCGDLHLHTGFLVAAVTALAGNTCLWGLSR